MCIRDRDISFPRGCNGINKWANPTTIYSKGTPIHVRGCLLYTSDAADDLLCVDLGGRRIIKKFKNQFSSLPVEDISFPRGCNGINKWANPTTIYSKGTPIHVRGALLYNFYNKKHKLTHKYPLIQDGEKVKFVYLKTPNRMSENVISYLNTFPKEFELNKHIDYDLQFTKTFLDPIKVILDTIGWQPEKVASLEFLFT